MWHSSGNLHCWASVTHPGRYLPVRFICLCKNTITSHLCRYYHRLINVPKLIDIKFAYVPRNMTLARMIRIYKVDSRTTLPGLREIEERDVPEVADLLARYMQRFDMVPLMTVDEVRHQFLSGRGELDQSLGNDRRPKQVVWTYVVEVSGVARCDCEDHASTLYSGCGIGSWNTPRDRLFLVLFPSIDGHQQPQA